MKHPNTIGQLAKHKNKNNPRTITQAQKEALKASLEAFGDLSGVIYNLRTGNLVGGHQRVDIFSDEQPEVRIVRGGEAEICYFETVNGERYLYREVDWPESKEKAAMIAANKHGGDWDNNLLAQLLVDVEKFGDLKLTGFTQEELTELQDALKALEPKPEKEDASDLIDKATQLQRKWKTKLGQIWEAGSHRIYCSDARYILKPLMNDRSAAMIWTDPPWNVGLGINPNPKRLAREIQNDKMDRVAFRKLLLGAFTNAIEVTLQGGPIYVAMSPQEWATTDQVLQEIGFHWSSTIIWAKDALILVRKDYHTQYEPIWYGWRDGSRRLRPVRDRKQSDVWSIPRPKRSEEHPTMKPVELVARAIRNSSVRFDIVLDPFLGSGTTAVACQETERVCYGVESDPKYIAVCLERLANLGLKPKLNK